MSASSTSICAMSAVRLPLGSPGTGLDQPRSALTMMPSCSRSFTVASSPSSAACAASWAARPVQ
eukprot:662823-Alexandrium_andersonii.AAC.1